MADVPHGLSGSSVVHVAVDARDRVGAQRAERIVVDEFDRLAGEFRRADPAALDFQQPVAVIVGHVASPITISYPETKMKSWLQVARTS